MAHIQQIIIPSHPNIYNGNNERTNRIEYSIPQNGTNDQTGIILIVPGFNANIDSKVYKKMREQFADNYNLVAVQCDYFGNKFMQSNDQLLYSLDVLKRWISKDDFEMLRKDGNEFYKIFASITMQSFYCRNRK